jgi:hypothetical protein
LEPKAKMENLLDLEDISYRYIVGIDLGTTNSALAYIDRTKPDEERQPIRFFEVPQLVSLGEVGRRSILPSFLYLPGPYELPPKSTALPWDPKRDHAVGEFAREQGAAVPGRLVSSAKSWLCHGGVDRTAPILPWGAGGDVSKVSPVDASARYLRHLKEAWNQVMARGREGYRLEDQLVILTVPASFDEVARELTVTAARDAGLPRVILVEEPLAAFYAWLSRHEDDWREGMSPGQLILVCDVGGGTTDFTLVAIREGEKGLRFDRLAVGDHLMLGGDNMDLSLARSIEGELLGRHGTLDSKRWHQLWHQCRKAKEVLLGGADGPQGTPSSPPPESTAESSVSITIMGSGGKLIGGTLKGALTSTQVEEIILEGFFPFVALDEAPHGGRRAGLTEWGLPYVQDPAVTRHMAAFWQRYRILIRQETGRSSLFPDYLLFNGGALTPASIRKRILSVVQSWFRSEAGEGWAPVELENPRPELAVAIGAAYYGTVRLGEGVRVGAGSPRAYYVQVAPPAGKEDAHDQGMISAVCLVPRGTEEGFETQLTEPSFQLLTNQPVSFQLFSSSTRLGDHLGEVVALSKDEVTPLPSIKTVLRYGKKGAAQTLPVQLAIGLTEVGTLELWCQSQMSSHRWQLQFDVRQSGEVETAAAETTGETVDANLIQEAQGVVRATFQGVKTVATAEGLASQPPEQLTKTLVSILDLGKERWSTTMIRKLADTLLECREGRSLTQHHEARWLNLTGFCMRPGFGDPLDEWRMREIWKLYPQSLQFARQAQSRSEWWIFWRRVAGGLSAGQQWHVYLQVMPLIQSGEKKKKKPGGKMGKSLSGQEELEIRMFLANLERLPSSTKAELGDQLLETILKGKPKTQELWALSRLGARIPFYGPLDQVISSRVVSSWVDALLTLGIEPSESLARAVVQLARRTGDRERDVEQAVRDRLQGWLAQLPQGSRLIELLTHPEASLMGQEKDWIFGEALPAGLILAS